MNLIRKHIGSNMRQDIVWTFSLQILIMFSSFAINKILSNSLSIDDFGQYNVIKRSVQVLSFMMLAGVGIALPRYIPIYRNSNPPQPITPLLTASFLYIIGISLVVFGGCIAFSKQMQEIIIGQQDNLTLLLIALFYAFILALSQYMFAYYRGIGNFKWYNGTQLAMQLAIIIPLVTLPFLTINKVFISWLLITIFIVICLFGKEILGHISQGGALNLNSPLKPHLSTIIKYSSGRLVADFFQFSLAAFPLIYISNNQGLQTTAYFSVGIFFVTMITPLFSFMGIILLPYISKAIAKHETANANRVVFNLSLLYMCVSMAIIIVLYLFTGFFTSLLFSRDYLVTTEITRIMIMSILPQAAYMLYRNTIDAVSITPYNAIILGISLAFMVVCFMLSDTLTHYAISYLTASVLQGFLSWTTWMLIRKK